MSVVVAGGAGFIGSHLVDRLVKDGKEVVVLDDLCTGYIANLEAALATGRCTFVYCDVAGGTRMLREMIAKAAKSPVTQIYHLASPDSRKAYTTMPWDTLTVNSVGTMSLVDLAIEYRATLLFASSSEIYGDPLVHPQAESYTGNVNPVGRRACYEESKRFGEMTLSVGIERRGLDGRIVRLFDTYGPRMAIGDGRLIPSVLEAIGSKSAIEIHGNGQQTRSFTYVTDIVSGLLAVMRSRSPHVQPVNLGSDNEITVEEIARSLAHIAGVPYDFVYRPVRPEDPRRSRPDLRVARSMGWSARMPLGDGLRTTHDWFTAVRPEFAYA